MKTRIHICDVSGSMYFIFAEHIFQAIDYVRIDLESCGIPLEETGPLKIYEITEKRAEETQVYLEETGEDVTLLEAFRRDPRPHIVWCSEW